MRAFRIVFLGLAASATVAAAPAFVPLAARPGLWQMTVQMHGAPPIPAAVLARMPEAQRAKIIADAQKPTTLKQCITAEQLRNGFDPTRQGGQHCTRTVVESAGSGFSMHMVCKSAHSTVEGTFRLAVVDAGNFRGSSDMTLTMNGQPSHITSTMTGRWLGADCGHVKPGEVE